MGDGPSMMIGRHSGAPAPALFRVQQDLGVDTSLLEDSAQRRLRHVAGVVGMVV
jgi:hypothetical protein